VGLLDIDIHGPNIPNMLGIQNFLSLTNNQEISLIVTLDNLKVMSIGFFTGGVDIPLIWRGPLKHKIIEKFLKDVNWGELDYLIVDSPPGTGDEIISIVQLLNKVDGAVIVATPQNVALADVRRSVRFCLELKIPILGIIENMSGFVCSRCGEVVEIFKTGGAEKLAQEYKVPFLGNIPMDPKIVSSGDDGKPIIVYYPDSAPAKAFSEIISKIVESIKV